MYISTSAIRNSQIVFYGNLSLTSWSFRGVRDFSSVGVGFDQPINGAGRIQSVLTKQWIYKQFPWEIEEKCKYYITDPVFI